mmetsp:Transcript_68093/g.188451  ORF Transcript_68093/g.188451 Transcript_68093/m.188451 type:complete len:204 (+) Transcript_68093:1490-2101(+)
MSESAIFFAEWPRFAKASGMPIDAYALNAWRGVPSMATRPQYSSLKVLSGKGPPPGATPPVLCVLGVPCTSFHHSSASSKIRPPMHAASSLPCLMTSCVRATVALAWSASSSAPVLELNASAPNSATNIGFSLLSTQRSKRLPNVRPVYAVRPQTSTSSRALRCSGGGTIPYTVVTGCVVSSTLIMCATLRTLASAFANDIPE